MRFLRKTAHSSDFATMEPSQDLRFGGGPFQISKINPVVSFDLVAHSPNSNNVSFLRARKFQAFLAMHALKKLCLSCINANLLANFRMCVCLILTA